MFNRSQRRTSNRVTRELFKASHVGISPYGTPFEPSVSFKRFRNLRQLETFAKTRGSYKLVNGHGGTLFTLDDLVENLASFTFEYVPARIVGASFDDLRLSYQSLLLSSLIGTGNILVPQRAELELLSTLATLAWQKHPRKAEERLRMKLFTAPDFTHSETETEKSSLQGVFIIPEPVASKLNFSTLVADYSFDGMLFEEFIKRNNLATENGYFVLEANDFTREILSSLEKVFVETNDPSSASKLIDILLEASYNSVDALDTGIPLFALRKAARSYRSLN